MLFYVYLGTNNSATRAKFPMGHVSWGLLIIRSDSEQRFSTPADAAGIDNQSPPFPSQGGVENTNLYLPKFTSPNLTHHIKSYV